MKLVKIQNFARYRELVDRYGFKGHTSNDYIQKDIVSLISRDAILEYCTASNAFLFVKKHFGYRLYYYINDFDEVLDFSGMPELATEILYRGESFFPVEEVVYLEKCGFKRNLTRDQYVGLYKDLTVASVVPGVIVKIATTLPEVEWACELFNSSFDRASGDYISLEEHEYLLSTKSILVACSLDNQYLGALHQRVDNNVARLSHVAVTPGNRGKGVGKALLDTFVERNMISDKSRYTLWVQHQNKVATRMYQEKGFKYIGKSTISLIKNN